MSSRSSSRLSRSRGSTNVDNTKIHHDEKCPLNENIITAVKINNKVIKFPPNMTLEEANFILALIRGTTAKTTHEQINTSLAIRFGAKVRELETLRSYYEPIIKAYEKAKSNCFCSRISHSKATENKDVVVVEHVDAPANKRLKKDEEDDLENLDPTAQLNSQPEQKEEKDEVVQDDQDQESVISECDEESTELDLGECISTLSPLMTPSPKNVKTRSFNEYDPEQTHFFFTSTPKNEVFTSRRRPPKTDCSSVEKETPVKASCSVTPTEMVTPGSEVSTLLLSSSPSTVPLLEEEEESTEIRDETPSASLDLCDLSPISLQSLHEGNTPITPNNSQQSRQSSITLGESTLSSAIRSALDPFSSMEEDPSNPPSFSSFLDDVDDDEIFNNDDDNIN